MRVSESVRRQISLESRRRGLGLTLALGEIARHELAQTVEFGPAQLRMLQRRIDHRIDRAAPEADLEMHVRPRGAAGEADMADQLAPGDRRADRNAQREGREMAVDRGEI